MFKFLKKLWRDRRGNALVIAGACLPLFVGAAGLATDTIQWTLWKRQLQRAADSAAIAAVYQRESASGATSGVDAVVRHDLSLNLHTFYALKTGRPDCSGVCTLTYPADSGVETDQVQVTISLQQRLPFSSLFMRTAPTITATARAASIPAGGDACIEALDTASTTGVTFSGNSAVEMPDCDIFSNTAGSNSAIGKGSASVIANSVGGVGGIQQSNNFTVNAYRPYSPALADPFASVTPDTSQMKCAKAAVTTTTTTTVVDTPAWDETVTDKHGRTTVIHHPAVTHTETTTSTSYTGAAQALTDGMDITTMRDSSGNQANCFTALSVGSNKSLTIPDSYTGPIYINGGDATLQGNFTCANCTIVLTNATAGSTSIGQFKTNAGANINITAPTSGDYQGIAIMQDRRVGSCTGNCNTINGNSSSIITGAIYFPNQQIYYNGTGNTTAVCTMFVAKRIEFTGNSGTSNKFKSLADCSSEGLPSSATVRMVRLVG